MGIGAKIEELRKINKLTQAKLANKAGISRSYLADVERGRYNPSIETVKSISSALNVALDEFFKAAKIMKNLQVINRNEQLLVDSREVAEMVQKEHKHLLRDIDGYITVLSGSPKLDCENFFVSDTFENRGKQYPCYLLTRKGCDMVANKMTGEKGVLFTAEYVTQFEKMENRIKQPVEQLSPMLQFLINMEQEQKQINTRLDELEKSSTPNLVNEFIRQLTVPAINKENQKPLVNINSKEKSALILKLKKRLSDKHKMDVRANDSEYSIAKDRLFKNFRVAKWEDIEANKVPSVEEYIKYL
ncbi:Rha family transcriptional regulator [Clostridium gasigenes]|uniref:Rha family transcriptional regulator n=1 Tax=Clostridium gasigenes TaxID=94869 RepID=UPI001626599B|nr:Rha family transcriptional regulator [Clostridium gasigenes]MBB6622065.1 Rha family transcriptional regulator [Clostridium gasigenes]